MLRDDSTGGVTVDKVCYLPFYNNRNALSNTWVLGSIAMQNYYTVYDLTPADGSVSIGVAKKNLTYDYTNFIDDNGNLPEPHKMADRPKVVVVVFIVVFVLACLVGLIFCKKNSD
jgi:hypothetical protein